MPSQAGASAAGPVVLVAEDSPGQIRLLQEAFAECEIALSPLFVTEGEEVFAVLANDGEYDQTPAPALLLLDLALPTIDGYEVLQRLRASDAWQTLPIVIFSNSDDSETIVRCYELGANAYLTKPAEYDDLLTLVTRLAAFWLDQAELPNA